MNQEHKQSESKSWRLEEEPKWPFRITIYDGDTVVAQVPRYTYSTSQKTLEDLRNGVGIAPFERDNFRAANKGQLDQLTRIVTAVNEHESLKEQVRVLRDLLKGCRGGAPSGDQDHQFCAGLHDRGPGHYKH